VSVNCTVYLVKCQVRHGAQNKKGRRDDGPLEQHTGSKGRIWSMSKIRLYIEEFR
jgi:hypothetical protein